VDAPPSRRIVLITAQIAKFEPVGVSAVAVEDPYYRRIGRDGRGT